MTDENTTEQEENKISFLEKLESCSEYYQKLYEVLAPNEGDNYLPAPVKLMKDFAFKDLLTSSAHFRSFITLTEEVLKLKQELEKENEQKPTNYEVNIKDSDIQTTEKL